MEGVRLTLTPAPRLFPATETVGGGHSGLEATTARRSLRFGGFLPRVGALRRALACGLALGVFHKRSQSEEPQILVPPRSLGAPLLPGKGLLWGGGGAVLPAGTSRLPASREGPRTQKWADGWPGPASRARPRAFPVDALGAHTHFLSHPCPAPMALRLTAEASTASSSFFPAALGFVGDRCPSAPTVCR